MEHVELGAQRVARSQDAVIFEIDTDFRGLADFRTQIRVRQETEQPAGTIGTIEESRTTAGRVTTGDQRLGDRRRTITFRITDVRCEARYRRYADRDLGRKPIAAG